MLLLEGILYIVYLHEEELHSSICHQNQQHSCVRVQSTKGRPHHQCHRNAKMSGNASCWPCPFAS